MKTNLFISTGKYIVYKNMHFRQFLKLYSCLKLPRINMHNLDWLRTFAFLGGFVFFALSSPEVEASDSVTASVKYCSSGSVAV